MKLIIHKNNGNAVVCTENKAYLVPEILADYYTNLNIKLSENTSTIEIWVGSDLRKLFDETRLHYLNKTENE